MRYSILSILLIGIITLTSCNKETSDIDASKSEIELREGDLMARKSCFELVYPFEIILPDESTITIENEETLHTQLKAWYEAHPDSKERPGLSYPVQVTFGGDKSKIISSSEQMTRLKKHCDDKKGKERDLCFKLIYPITYIMPDGTSLTGENERDIKAQIKEWYTSNPDSDLKPVLSYPIDIKIIGGDVISVDNEEKMIAIKKRCSERDKIDCFKLDYPLDYTMPDGSIISVESENDMEGTLKGWYKSNPDSDKKPSLNYPVNVIFLDGKILTLNTEEEMIKLKKRCLEGK